MYGCCAMSLSLQSGFTGFGHVGKNISNSPDSSQLLEMIYHPVDWSIDDNSKIINRSRVEAGVSDAKSFAFYDWQNVDDVGRVKFMLQIKFHDVEAINIKPVSD